MKEDNIVKIDRTKSVITNHEVKRRLKRIWDDEGEKFVKIFKEVLVAVKVWFGIIIVGIVLYSLAAYLDG